MMHKASSSGKELIVGENRGQSMTAQALKQGI